MAARSDVNGVYAGKDGYLINDPVEKENNIEKNIKTFANFTEKNNFKKIWNFKIFFISLQCTYNSAEYQIKRG